MNIARLSVLLIAPVLLAKDPLAFIGTYTGEKSKGIYVADFSNGKLGPLRVAGEVKNPSFLAIHPNGKFLYAVTEAGKGTVTAFSLDPSNGTLKMLNTVSSKGDGPCFVTVDKTGKNALVVNYGSGSVAVLPINADGSLKEASASIQHQGSSVNKQRQSGPHAHSVNLSPDNKYAIVADLGLDKVFVYSFDPNAGTLKEHSVFNAKPGAGPRHFSFAPDGKHAYVINEMGITITALNWDAAKGTLTEIESVSTVPAGYSNPGNSTAEVLVHPSGKFVYGSNRGHDSIAVFKVDPGSGKLTLVQNESTQGKVPRNFRIDPSGKYLIAANQNTDNIVVFSIDQKTGELKPTGSTAEVGKPVCIRFLERK